jgi:hypothetical protein
LEVIVISKNHWQRIAGLFIMTGVAIYATVPLTRAQSGDAPAAAATSASPRSLDYEFFKTRIEPIFLKKRTGHTRCYACHSGAEGPAYLERLPPGSTSWTEDQSRLNFKKVSLFVVPGKPDASKLLTHPLAPEAGGDIPMATLHRGGRQFASKNDPDWKTLAEWVGVAKAGQNSKR